MKRSPLFVAVAAALALALAGTATAAGPRPTPSFADSGAAAQFEPARPYDMLNTRLDLSVDMDRNRLQGTATHTFSALKDGLASIPFHQSGLTIRGVTATGGRELKWYVDGDSLWVTLPEPLQRGETMAVTVDYEADNRPQGTFWITPNDDAPNRNPQLWTHGETTENRFWFPGYDSPNDLRTSETIVTVAKPYTVVANGALESVEDHGDRQTWTFKMDVPYANYLQTLVVGKFDVLEEDADGTPVQSYYDPKYGADAVRAYERTDDMVRLFNQKIGVPYPYSVYRQIAVEEYLFGGMEHASATTLTDRTFRDDSAYTVSNSEALISHELAHQWFGDFLTCQDWSNIWLNEGFATYMETVFYEGAYGHDRAVWDVHNNQASALRADRRYVRPMVTRYYEDDDDMFDSISYGKGACVLHMLRYQLGDDLFWEAIHKYVADNGPGNVTSEDLRRAAFDVSGQPLDRFFDQWVYRGGHPQVGVSWKWVPENSMVEITVKQTQKVSDLTPLFAFPVELDFSGDDWHQNQKVWITGDKHSFYFQTLERPKMVEFDREGWILKDLTFKKSTAEWIYQLDHSPAVLSRRKAAEALAKKNEDASVRALARCLQNPQEFFGVREEAAKSLGALGSDPALAALKDGLGAEDARVRDSIAEALGKFTGEAPLAAVRGIVNGDPSSPVVSEAVRAAGRIGGDEALAVIETGLARGNDWRENVRRAALTALQTLKDPANLDLVFPYAKPGTYYETRGDALETLGRLGAELKDDQDKTRDRIRRELERSLDSSIISVQESAADGLRYLGDPEALTALERKANGVTHTDVVHRCETAMDRLRTDPDQDKNSRRAVLERLETLEKKNRRLEDELETLRGRLRQSEEEGGGEAP